MRRASPFLTFLAALTGLLLAGCSQDGGNDGQRARGPATVGVVTIAPQRAELATVLPGRTRAVATSEVRPQVSGVLQKRLFTEGGEVTAGQPLYRIDDTLYTAALDQARAQLANARAALTTAKLKAERYATLKASRLISQQDYDDAQAGLEQAQASVQQQQAAVESAQADLGYTTVTAPIGGRISRSYLTEGALVTANQSTVLATIQTLDPIYVDLNQSSSALLALQRAEQAGRVRLTDGGAAVVTLTMEDGAPYPQQGTLEFKEVTVDESTGTVTLRARFPNPEHLLRPGMYVRARVVEAVQQAALLIPQRGVTRNAKGEAVALLVDADGKVRQRVLQVSRTVGADWLVEEGLKAGDRVIVEGLQNARPGDAVNAVPFVPEAPANPDELPEAAPAGGA